VFRRALITLLATAVVTGAGAGTATADDGVVHHQSEAQLKYGESEYQTPVRPPRKQEPSELSAYALAALGTAALMGLLIVG
jgi:hypothetical protein